MPNEATNRWRSLYDRIAKVYPTYRYVPKPTPQAIDEFEATAVFALPHSYREFIEVFGPGELSQRFQFHAPGYAKRNKILDLSHFNQLFRECKAFFPKETMTNLIARQIVFCVTISGDWIGWDPQDVCDPVNHEYGIYNIGRC